MSETKVQTRIWEIALLKQSETIKRVVLGSKQRRIAELIRGGWLFEKISQFRGMGMKTWFAGTPTALGLSSTNQSDSLIECIKEICLCWMKMGENECVALNNTVKAGEARIS